MKLTPNKIEFDYHGWHCWQNDSTGDWGAILSWKGERRVVIDRLTDGGIGRNLSKQLMRFRNSVDWE
jgi:hypothetical protein